MQAMQKKSVINLIFQKRMLVVLLLGFASGLPLALTGALLQAWYSVEGLGLATIGLLGLAGQPYIYKVIWAPAVDKFELFPIGRRRSWMLVTQALMVVLLSIMAFFEPKTAPITLALLALGVAFLSATQDVAIDAYRTEILSKEERGLGAAMAVAGYRVGMLVSGGLAFIIAGYLGFKITFLFMALCVGLGMIVTLYSDEPTHYGTTALSFKQACMLPLVEFLQRKNAVVLLLFIILYKLGDAFAGSLTTAFLLRGLGFSLVDVGLINKTIGLAGTLFGVFCGGVLLSRTTLFKALLGFGVIQALSNLTYLGLMWTESNYTLMSLAVFLENLGGGLGTSAFFALLMSLCDKRYTATQFALFSALSSIGRVYVGPLAGMLVESVGWSEFFLWSIVFSLPGLFLLYWLKEEITAPLSPVPAT